MPRNSVPEAVDPEQQLREKLGITHNSTIIPKEVLVNIGGRVIFNHPDTNEPHNGFLETSLPVDHAEPFEVSLHGSNKVTITMQHMVARVVFTRMLARAAMLAREQQ